MEEKKNNLVTILTTIILTLFTVVVIAVYILLFAKLCPCCNPQIKNEVSLIWSLTAVTIVLISCVTIIICHFIKVNAKKEVELKESKTNEDLISAYKEVFEKDKSKIYNQKSKK